MIKDYRHPLPHEPQSTMVMMDSSEHWQADRQIDRHDWHPSIHTPCWLMTTKTGSTPSSALPGYSNIFQIRPGLKLTWIDELPGMDGSPINQQDLLVIIIRISIYSTLVILHV